MIPEKPTRALRRYQRFTIHSRKARLKHLKGEPTAAELRALSPVRETDDGGGTPENRRIRLFNAPRKNRTGGGRRVRTVQERRLDEIFTQDAQELGLA